MKLSPLTTKILKNFASINAGMLFRKGVVQYTISPLSTIIAEAILPDCFERTFAIYDLEGFLKILKTFDDPELVFEEYFISIKENRKSAKFFYSDPSLVISPKKEPYAHDDVSLQFLVDSNTLKNIWTVSEISSYFKYLRIWSNEGMVVLSLTAKEVKERAINSYDIEVGSLENQKLKDFSLFIQLENLKVLEGDYEFVISELPAKTGKSVFILRLCNQTIPVTYWTSLENE